MDFNYSDLLAFDRASSVTLTKSKAARKLAAWANRLTSTDYPSTWVADFLNGTVETLSGALVYAVSDCTDSAFNGQYVYRATESRFRKSATISMWRAVGVGWSLSDGTTIYTAPDNGLNTPPAAFTKTGGTATVGVVASTKAWESASLVLKISFTNTVASSYILEYGSYSYSGSLVVEGFLTLTYGALTTRLNICDPEVRHGDDETKIEFNGIPRAAITDELDEYISSRLNRLENETIKGYGLDGVWRLTGTYKVDSDSPDKTNVILLYKRGYAQTLDFSEALLMSKEDWNTDSYNLTIKFPNIDPRYAETAKASVISALTDRVIANPVFGGVVYDGYWNSIKMITSETSSQAGATGNPEDSSNVIWFLTRHNNTDLYFKFQAGPDTIKGFYYKWEATETTLAELIDDKQFDADGDIVTSGGKTLQEVVAGRTVQMRRTSRDPEDRLFDVEIEITWSEAYTLSDAEVSIVFQKAPGASVTVDQGFNIPDTLLSAYSAHYKASADGGDLAENQLGNFQFERDQENGTFRYIASITTLTARQGYLDVGGSWIFYGSNVVSTSAISVPAAIDATESKTWAQLKTALQAFEVQGSVRVQDDGTFAYNLQVTKAARKLLTEDSATYELCPDYTPYDLGQFVFTTALPLWLAVGSRVVFSGSSISGLNGCFGIVSSIDDIGMPGTFAFTINTATTNIPSATLTVIRNSPDGSITITADVYPFRTSAITQRWTEQGKAQSTLPVDIYDTFDEVDGKWYETVQFDYDITGVGLYNWKKVTTRHQILVAGYAPFSATNKWEKKEKVFNRSSKRVRMKTRGQWKREVVPWQDAWDASVGSTTAPATWLSGGYQAKYGNWQSWYVKAYNETEVPVEAPAYSAYASYYVGAEVSYGGYNWRLATAARSVGNAPSGSNTSNSYWTYTGVLFGAQEELVPYYSASASYAYGNVVKMDSGWGTVYGYSLVNIPTVGVTPATGSAWTKIIPSGALTGDNFGAFIGRVGTGSMRYSPDYFGQRAMNFWYKANEYGTVGGTTFVEAQNIWKKEPRDLDSQYLAKVYGFSIYNKEVLLLKTHEVKEEFIRWNPVWEFSSALPYVIGEVVYYSGAWKQFTSIHPAGAWNAAHVTDTVTNNPYKWNDWGYVARYGAFNTSWGKSTVTSGDNAGDFLGVVGASSQRYTPPPETDGLYKYFMTNQYGTLGGTTFVEAQNIWKKEPRDLENTLTAQICGYSVYSIALVRAIVLNELGAPELDDSASAMYTSDWYEQPAFCEAGQRIRRRITSTTYRRYFVVNPTFVSNNGLPTSLNAMRTLDAPADCYAHPDDSNAETEYETVALSEYLWAVQKTVIRFGTWEADTLHKTSDPSRGGVNGAMTGEFENFPNVDQNGCYMFYHTPAVSQTILGKAPTTGAYPLFKDIT